MKKKIKITFTVNIDLDAWMSEYDIESKKEAIEDAKAKLTDDADNATRSFLARLGLLAEGESA